MNYTTQKGLLTEIQCQKDFSERGILLSQPIINDSRYDYLADINKKIYKIQCKSASPVAEDNRAFSFATFSKNWNNGERHDYSGEIDFFYTCFLGKGYLIPVEETGKRIKTLRLLPPLNNNQANITWASDYEIDKILSKMNYTIPVYEKFINPCNLEPKKENYCAVCGKTISRNATYCIDCIKKIQKNSSGIEVNNLTKEKLKDLIRTENFTTIGKLFNVSDNTIRKWCKDFSLPSTKIEINKYTDEEWRNI